MLKASTLGARIAQARREKGVREHRDISQSEIAEAIGVTTANYSRWESDQRVPRDDALAKLATFLETTPAYLRYGVATVQEYIPEEGHAYLARQRAEAEATKKAAPRRSGRKSNGGKRGA